MEKYGINDACQVFNLDESGVFKWNYTDGSYLSSKIRFLPARDERCRYSLTPFLSWGTEFIKETKIYTNVEGKFEF